MMRPPVPPPRFEDPAPRPRRVLGSLADLARRERRPDEEQLAAVLTRWSLSANHEWLLDGVRRGEPFLQISNVQPSSVLAWELDRLAAEGYVGIGPLWVPVAWFRDARRYRHVVELVAEHLLAQEGTGEPHYVPKARAELTPLLALWPHVLALPTTQGLSIDELILARAWPVHPLGVVPGPRPGDGRMLEPKEFWFHDLDHARFKVREDLLARGVSVPDAYEGASSFDAQRGVHRTFLTATQAHVDADGWRRAAERAAFARALLRACAEDADAPRGEAACWLLFELVHEKSLPLDATVLARALATPAHEQKLRLKCAKGFFGAHGPEPAAVARLGDARAWLGTLLQEVAS